MNEILSFQDALKLPYPYYFMGFNLNVTKIKKYIKQFQPIYEDKVPAKFNSQKNELETYNGNYLFIKDDWLKNQELNNLTDYFSEIVRVHCQFGGKDSPINYWIKNKKYILNETIHKYNTLTLFHIREMMFEKTKLCNNFRISVCLAILKMFSPKKWLDISAGWGDRLLAAVLYGVDKYVACDPNLDLHPCYKKIIDTFVPEKKRENFKVYPQGFEHLKLKNNDKFDLVFSSPPFFVLEIYSKFEENSVIQYKNEKTWVEKFFIKSLIKCYNHLRKDGHMILYMGGSEYVFQQMHKLDKIMEYLGVIYFYDTRPRGMFVWKKIRDDTINTL